ncbi:MAG: hypothetical protein BM558_06335 [Roseobacter sp. MedPE-SW]|nr:MAG: hypothetical protein BM558_06335 [Roseobacter sp. MedPE-SW]
MIFGLLCDSQFEDQAVNMSNFFWLTDVQMEYLEPFFPNRTANLGSMIGVRHTVALRQIGPKPYHLIFVQRLMIAHITPAVWEIESRSQTEINGA